MDRQGMSAEVTVALITAVSVIGAAVVAVAPALRRTRGAVEAEGLATREAMEAQFAALNVRIDDARDDIDDVREGVVRVREWQAGHDAEHLLIGRPRPGGNA
jgi:hypothetical protein